MNKKTNNCILLFVKYPEAGKVKTRLAETVGPDDAAKLYSMFVKDILITLRNREERFVVCYDNRWTQDQYIQWLGDEIPFVAQQGTNIGEKMKNAFINAFDSGIDNAIVIGSDIPDIPADNFTKGFAALSKHKAVVAPTTDGGYCLIGFSAKGFLPKIFDNIDWSTEKVFNQTMKLFERHKINFYGLDRWSDIDTFGDLQEFIARNKKTDLQKTISYEYARKLIGKVTDA